MAAFAAVPRTNFGLMSIAPAVAAATPMNFRRSSSLEKFGRFASPVMFPPVARYYPIRFSKRSEEHTSELQSRGHLVCRLLLEKKKKKTHFASIHFMLESCSNLATDA